MERETENKQGQRTRLLRRIVFAQEEERRRIARDLHDHFGQQLTTFILQLGMLKERCREQPEVYERLATLEADAKQLDSDVDALVHELRPSALDDLGLAAALNKHCGRWSERFGIPLNLHTSGLEKHRLPNAVETALYRIAQEALNNVAKHSRATRVDVLLQRHASEVSLIIEDDGIGSDPAAPAPGNAGLGLLGMRERAALVGGVVIIETAPGKGLTVFVRIPTAQREAQAPAGAQPQKREAQALASAQPQKKEGSR